MDLSPALDFTAGYILAALGTAAMLYWNIPAILLETKMLENMLSVSAWRALRNAFVMNFATTVLGFYGYTVSYTLDRYFQISKRMDVDPYYHVGTNITVYFALLYAASLVISALVEGVLLMTLEPKISKIKLWFTSWGVNALSYAVCPVVFGLVLPGLLTAQ